MSYSYAPAAGSQMIYFQMPGNVSGALGFFTISARTGQNPAGLMETSTPFDPGIDNAGSVPVPIIGAGTLKSATLICDTAATSGGGPFVDPSTLRISLWNVGSTARTLVSNLDFLKTTGNINNNIGSSFFERMHLSGLSIAVGSNPLGAVFENRGAADQINAAGAMYLAIEVQF